MTMPCQGDCYSQLLSIQPSVVHPAHHDYFQDNIPVPDEETFPIRDILDKASAHLGFISSQVGQIQEILDHLLLVREQQTQFVQRHQSMLSTFRQIPNEILGEIFCFCLLDDRKGDSKPLVGNVSKDVRWRLSAVCSRWRRIICDGMPELWASIGIDNASLSNAESARVDTLLKTCLARSGTYPLSVEFNLFASRWLRNMVPTPDRKCMELIWNESMRWKEMSLDDFPPEVLGQGNVYANTVIGRLPLLRRLSLRPSIQPQSSSTSNVITAFSSAPNLRHARILAVPHPVVSLPWIQLLSYEAEHDQHGTLYVLGLARNLEKYVALDPKSRASHPDPNPNENPNTDTSVNVSHPLSLSISDPLSEPLIHSSLQTLSLAGKLVPILSDLSLPALKTLQITGMNTKHFHILTSFLIRNYSVALHLPHLSNKSKSRGFCQSRTDDLRGRSYVSYCDHDDSPDDEAIAESIPKPTKLDTLQISVSVGAPVPMEHFVRAVGVAGVKKLELYGPGHLRVKELLKALTIPTRQQPSSLGCFFSDQNDGSNGDESLNGNGNGRENGNGNVNNFLNSPSPSSSRSFSPSLDSTSSESGTTTNSSTLSLDSSLPSSTTSLPSSSSPLSPEISWPPQSWEHTAAIDREDVFLPELEHLLLSLQKDDPDDDDDDDEENNESISEDEREEVDMVDRVVTMVDSRTLRSSPSSSSRTRIGLESKSSNSNSTPATPLKSLVLYVPSFSPSPPSPMLHRHYRFRHINYQLRDKYPSLYEERMRSSIDVGKKKEEFGSELQKELKAFEGVVDVKIKDLRDWRKRESSTY